MTTWNALYSKALVPNSDYISVYRTNKMTSWEMVQQACAAPEPTEHLEDDWNESTGEWALEIFTHVKKQEKRGFKLSEIHEGIYNTLAVFKNAKTSNSRNVVLN